MNPDILKELTKHFARRRFAARWEIISMATLPKPYYTEAEYLARERRAEYKSEYYRGEIFAMAGATKEHNSIVINVGSELRQQLKTTGCQVYPSDMRVRL